MPQVIPQAVSRKLLRQTITARWQTALLPRRVRASTVFIVSLAHAVAIVSTLAFATLHDFIDNSSQMKADFQQLGSTLLLFFPPVRWACYVAAACHGLAFVHIMYRVVKHICSKSTRIVAHAARVHRFASVLVQGPTAQLVSRTSWWKRLSAFVVSVLATYPVEVTQARLLVEVAMQTFQANKMSKLVATVWINRLLACVIVVNCWFAPVVYAVMKHQSPFETRVVRLSIDTLLDAIYCFGIPLAILYPYMIDYNPILGSFPYDNYVMDTWTAVVASETKQLFVSSWFDFVSKVSPWFFFCYRLWSLRRIVHARDISNRSADSNVAVQPARTVSRVLNAVLIGWGIAVLAIHVHVSYIGQHASSLGCLLAVRPWLKTAHTCTVLEVSCSQRRITGTRQEITDALAEVDEHEIQNLGFSHCPSLDMPPAILKLTNVAMLKFYNSTVHDWDQDAMLTKATNGNVQQLFVIETNFSRFPEGLLSPQMSDTLRDVKFITTNLTTLPDSLSTAFRSVKYFVIEDSPLGHVPRAITRLSQLMFVSLGSNGIHYIPPEFLQTLPFHQARFVNNPLDKIPEAIGKQPYAVSIVVKYTNVEDIPASWLTRKDDESLGAIIVEAQCTPLCDRLLAARNRTASWNGRGFDFGRVSVMCEDPYGFYSNISYPVDKERLWRERNR